MKQAVIGILFSEDRSKVLILLRRDVYMWVFPGGGVDKDETPENAIKREVLEETGLQVKIVKKIGVYTPLNGLSCLTHVFECREVGGKITTTNESRAVKFCAIDDLPRDFFFIHKEWLQDALSNNPQVILRPIYSATYMNLVKYLLLHPIKVIRFFLSRMGFPINS